MKNHRGCADDTDEEEELRVESLFCLSPNPW